MWNIRKKYSHVPDQMFCLPASVFVCFAPVALPLHRIWRYYTSTILPLDDNHVWCRKSHTGKMLTSGCGLWWCHLCVFPTPQHIGLQLTQSQPYQRLPLKPTLLFFFFYIFSLLSFLWTCSRSSLRCFRFFFISTAFGSFLWLWSTSVHSVD